jgi:hypothetical protein
MHKVLNQNWKTKRKSKLQKCNKSIIKFETSKLFMNPKPLTLDPMACALYKLEKKPKPISWKKKFEWCK